MSLSVSNVLLPDEVEYINNLPEVLNAKDRLDSKSSGFVYFTIPLTSAMKTALYERIGLNVMAMESIPMRWIKGDTSAHIDTGARSFEKTHLVYLTDSPGQLILDTAAYPITRGTGYVFSESVRHETVHTGSEPRLLLGPMSEEGFSVGIAGIAGTGGSTIYIRQFESEYEYSYDQISWPTLYFPTTVTNTDTTAGVLTIEFISEITFTSQNDYFVCSSSHIQFGSASLKTNGRRPIIRVEDVNDYPGLIQNGDSVNNGYNNIYVYNLDVRATVSTLYSSGGNAGGWIGQYYYGKGATDNYIINCTSDGDISAFGGGIVGNFAGADAGASLTIIGCSSSGTISDAAGGIVGHNASYNSGSVVCDSCWSTGLINNDGGGITGNATGYAVITNCYSTGAISGRGGGICGSVTARIGRLVTITNCYSTGSIDAAAGGIVGPSAGTIIITNCYSLGNLAGADAGGIIANTNVGGQVITHCYTVGSVVGGQGYITGLSATVPATCYSEAKTGTPGSWNSTNANTVLQEIPAPVVGTTWVSTGENQPYELRIMGYTPYALTNISTTPSLVRINSATLAPGDSTNPAIITGEVSYTILDITGGDSGSYPSITIDNTTGVITTSSTVDGVYTIYLRNTGSYNITEYELTVSSGGGGGGTVEGETCCSRPLYINGVDYPVRTNIIAGNVMIGNTSTRKYPMFASDLLKMKQAYASKR